MSSTVTHQGDGVWIAVLDQDAMENIAYYMAIGGQRSTCAQEVGRLADQFREALDSAFPDGAQDPTPRPYIPAALDTQEVRE